eukprot:1460118-Pyramimonas_sp.AAC.1
MKYADDLTKLHVGGSAASSIDDAALEVLNAANRHSNQLLDTALATGGWAQNRAKQNTIVSL